MRTDHQALPATLEWLTSCHPCNSTFPLPSAMLLNMYCHSRLLSRTQAPEGYLSQPHPESGLVTNPREGWDLLPHSSSCPLILALPKEGASQVWENTVIHCGCCSVSLPSFGDTVWKSQRNDHSRGPPCGGAQSPHVGGKFSSQATRDMRS